MGKNHASQYANFGSLPIDRTNVTKINRFHIKIVAEIEKTSEKQRFSRLKLQF